MKIRIKGNTVRYRLTQTEVQELKKTGLIEGSTSFPAGARFSYSLMRSAADDKITATLVNGNISVLLPASKIAAWADTDQVGIEKTLELSNGETLELLIEKDFQCLKPRVGEDESDNFPNPLAAEL